MLDANARYIPKGDYFKKKGNIYLSGFTKDYLYVPFQILYLGEVK
jgi:hypothetical protein